MIYVKEIVIIFISCLLGYFSAVGFAGVNSEKEFRRNVTELLRSAGLDDKLDTPVRVSVDDSGIFNISDEGKFFMQYIVRGARISSDANVEIDPNLSIGSSCRKAVIVTHGWFDKGKSDWPADIAAQIKNRVDPTEWLCGFFDWQGGAKTVNPIDAVKYARQIAGVRFAKAFLELGIEWEHIHLIGHSSGCWVVNTAAKMIAEKTNASIHITFLDAYVPPLWKEAELGEIQSKGPIWIEHYYTRDFTLERTEVTIPRAHNVDISSIDSGVNEHKFPYRWYYATVAGKYREQDPERDEKVVTDFDGTDYGFVRSREAGESNWQNSLEFPIFQDRVGPVKKKSFWEILEFWK